MLSNPRHSKSIFLSVYPLGLVVLDFTSQESSHLSRRVEMFKVIRSTKSSELNRIFAEIDKDMRRGESRAYRD